MDDLNRRDLIAGGAAFAAAAGLAACSPAPAGNSSSGAGQASATSSAAGSATSSAAGSAPSSATVSGVTVKAADVPVGGGTILANANYVVTQPSAGTYKAFNKTCTHQGCPVSKIVGSNIVCACHGSTFSIVDGSVTNPPATKPLPAAKVTDQGGTLVISG